VTDGDRALPRPRLPKKGANRPVQNNATFLALGGLLAVGLGFVLLIALVMTGFAPAGVVIVLLLMGLVGFFFGGHYLLWGVWLDRRLMNRGESERVEFWKQTPAPLPPIPAEDEPE
jgi:fatty acid desaturase